MVSAESKSVIDRANQIYVEQLKQVLEVEYENRFVAIEPESGEYFLGDTFDAAVKGARSKFPLRLSHTIRIGHEAAFHIGVLQVSYRVPPHMFADASFVSNWKYANA